MQICIWLHLGYVISKYSVIGWMVVIKDKNSEIKCNIATIKFGVGLMPP